MADDDKTLPARSGGIAGKDVERVMSGQDGRVAITTRIRNYPDGTVVRYKSRAGNPEFIVEKTGGATTAMKFYLARTTPLPEFDDPADKQRGTGYSVFEAKRLSGPENGKHYRSPDGVLELWARETATGAFKRAKHGLSIDDTADADGPHSHELQAWLYRPTINGDVHKTDDCELLYPCEVDDGRIVGFGMPYHGEIRSGKIYWKRIVGLVEVTDEIPLPAGVNVDIPDTILVKFPDSPPVTAPSVLSWKNYAILFGKRRYYYPFNNTWFCPSGQGGSITHLYRPASGGIPFLIKTSLVITNDVRFFIRCIATKATPKEPSENPTELQVEIFPNRQGAFPATFFYPSPDGRKILVVVVRDYGSTDYYTYNDIRRGWELCSVYEITITGDDSEGAPLAASLATLKNYLFESTNSPQQSYPNLSGTPIYYFPNQTSKSVAAAMYDKNGNLVIYEVFTNTDTVYTSVSGSPPNPDYVYTVLTTATHQLLRNGVPIKTNVLVNLNTVYTQDPEGPPGPPFNQGTIDGVPIPQGYGVWSGAIRASNNVLLYSTFSLKSDLDPMLPRDYYVVTPSGILPDVTVAYADAIPEGETLAWVSLNPETEKFLVGKNKSWC